mgnify:CR=1 FL=1
MILDTPGQIEVFTWSASGTIITETLVNYILGKEREREREREGGEIQTKWVVYDIAYI